MNWAALLLSAIFVATGFGSDVPLILFHATVTDKGGELLLDLPKAAFHVFEGRTEQQIALFRREDTPVSMGILLDNSGTMRGKRAEAEEAALALIKASNGGNEFFIANFGAGIRLGNFTTDLAQLEIGLRAGKPNGPTALYEAIFRSIEFAQRYGRHARKALVIFTDGGDNASETTVPKVIRLALESGVLIQHRRPSGLAPTHCPTVRRRPSV